MEMRRSTLIPLLLATVCGTYAQVPQPSPSPSDATARQQLESDMSKDDILIIANITAKELRFDAVPNTHVDFPGTQKRTNIWVTQRQNLPEQVQPGVTYHDVGLQLRISTRFADIEQIVKDAVRESGQSAVVNSILIPPASDPGASVPSSAPPKKH